MMRIVSKWFFGAAAGLLAAPLVGWSVAVMLSHFEVTHFVLESPFGGVLKLSCKEGIPGVPLQVGLGVAVVAGIFLSYLLVRLNLRWSKGWYVTGATLLGCAGCYTWLMWDEPIPEPIPMDKLLPHPGVVCMPREQVLEACKDNPFSKVAEWPVGLIALKDAECSMAWTLEHEPEIRANWEKLRPVREWIVRVNRFEAFDDYVDEFAKPVLAFQPLRQFTWSSRQMALLCAAKEDTATAIQHLGEMLTFSYRLQQGSRCLVTLMIGVVVEKITLKTIQSLLAEKVLTAAQREALARVVDQRSTEWDDLERCLLNDCTSHEKVLQNPAKVIGQMDPPWLRAFLSVAFNRNATVREIRDEYERIAVEARNPGGVAVQGASLNAETEVPLLRWKNYLGLLTKTSRVPPTKKLGNNLRQKQELRAKVLEELRKPFSP